MTTFIALSCAMLFLWLMVAGAWNDLFVYRIPNIFSLLSLPLFFTFAMASQMPLEAMLVHIYTGLGVFFVTFILFALGFFGGGDAKMMSAIALWLGFDGLMPFLLGSLFIGGAFGVVLMAIRRCSYPPAWLVGIPHLHGVYAGAVYEDETMPTAVPYGVPMAAALLLLLPENAVFAPFFRASTGVGLTPLLQAVYT
jgi:prepilin peptidase CpaA